MAAKGIYSQEKDKIKENQLFAEYLLVDDGKVIEKVVPKEIPSLHMLVNPRRRSTTYRNIFLQNHGDNKLTKTQLKR